MIQRRFPYLTICILYLIIINFSYPKYLIFKKKNGQKFNEREYKLHQLMEFRQNRQILGLPFLMSKSAIWLFILLQVCFSDLWYLRWDFEV